MKELFLKTALVCISLLAPIHSMIIATGVLIIADMILGIWAAKKRGEKITSAGMRRTISKFFVYQIVLITGFVIEIWLLQGLFPISKLVAGVIAVVEGKSLLENANTIYGSPIFKDIIEKLGSTNDKKE